MRHDTARPSDAPGDVSVSHESRALTMHWMQAAAVVFWGTLALMVYTQFGYALAVALVGAVRRPRPAPADAATYRPPVTLIVPAYNEQRVIRAKIENALELDYPPGRLEIIVTSDGSSDDTDNIVREFADRGVRLSTSPDRNGKPTVVARAIALAGGEVVCLCDANVMFALDAIRKLVDRLADPMVGAASGDVRLVSEMQGMEQGEGLFYRLERWTQRSETRAGSLIGVDGGMYVIRRHLIPPIPRDTLNEDFTLAMAVLKRGQRVVYEPEAVAHEDGPPTAQQELRRRVRLAAGSVQSILRGDLPPLTRPIEFWQYLSHKFLRWCGPFILLAMLLANVALWQAGWVYRVALVGQIAFYALGLAAHFSLPLRQTRLGGVVYYFVMSHAAMFLGTFQGLLKMQPVTWKKADRRVVAG